MKKYDLMFCSLGNGLTVCNRASAKNGDYDPVAHISPAGNINWYKHPHKIPGSDLLRIEHHANAMESTFAAWFNELPPTKQYDYLLDRAPSTIMIECFGMKSEPLPHKIEFLRSKLWATL